MIKISNNQRIRCHLYYDIRCHLYYDIILVGFVSICTQDAYFQHRASTAKKKNQKKQKTQQQLQQTNKTINNKTDCRYKFILKYSQVKMTESHHNNYISQPFNITFFRKLLVIVFLYGYFKENTYRRN